MKVQFDCVDCKNCMFDPDCVNDCEKGRYDFFHKRHFFKCPDYTFDEKYATEQFEEALKIWKN